MKRLAIVFFVVLAAALFYRSFGSAETGTGSLTLPQPAPSVGDHAPEFRVESVDGRDFELSDHGVYVLTFWSTLNKDSNEAVPGFEDLARRYEDDGASFAVVYVNSAPSDESVPYTMLLDQVQRQEGAKAVRSRERYDRVRPGLLLRRLREEPQGGHRRGPRERA